MNNILFSSFANFLFLAVIVINTVTAYLVIRSNHKSATNIIFTFLSAVTTIWLFFIMRSNHPATLTEDLWFTRLTVFFAVPQSVLFFLLAHTLPSNTLLIRKSILYGIVIACLAMMGLTLSPYVFKDVQIIDSSVQGIPGPAIPVFALFTSLFSVAAIYVLAVKIKRSTGQPKSQLILMMRGILWMLGLIILTIMVPVIFFHDGIFLQFAPLYALIFLGMTGYAVVRYQLFSLKVLATEACAGILWIVLISRTLSAPALQDKIVEGIVFLAVFVFGLLLIKSVRREVEQREELQRLNKQIEEKNAKLEELSHFKSELLSLASHQVRSPLAAMKGFVSLILQGAYGPVGDKVKETLGKVLRSADDLIGLINTLLDVRKVEEGKMEYKFEKVDLGEMVAGVVDSLSPLAETKKIALTFDFQKKQVFVSADKEKFRQVVQNLIDNAIKYTPSGFVKVALAVENGKAVFSVADSGLGIPADLIPYLFEEFVRDERVKKEIRGTGLGLYIARKIIEAHSGTIKAESAGEGKGSTFIATLPLAAA